MTQIKKELTHLYLQLSNKAHSLKEPKKQEMKLAEFRDKNAKIYAQIDTLELKLYSLQNIIKAIPVKIEVNLADEHQVSDPNRRLVINMVKTMNYNCEKELQKLLLKHHDRKDETLSIITHLVQQPGRVRKRSDLIEVEIDRMPTERHAKSVDLLVREMNQMGILKTPDGIPIQIHQVTKHALAS